MNRILQKMKSLMLILALALLVAGIQAKSISYRQGRNKKYMPELIPVASTVIPLEDLPVYKVGVGIGFELDNIENTVIKPEGPIKLVTAKKTKKPTRANVKEVSKKEFEKTR